MPNPVRGYDPDRQWRGVAVAYDVFMSYSHAADSALAPSLQSALQRFAKPWYRRRSLQVFRDRTGLSVSPGLWTSISSALDESDWFLVLASPESAASPWVAKEIDHWRQTKGGDRILLVLTDGELAWDPAAGNFDVARSTAASPALHGAFSEEPIHVDMRWARTAEELSLRHSRFRDQVAELAAPVFGRPKDELEGEDVRQHRRTLRLAWGAAGALGVLTVASLLAAVLAVSFARAADAARDEADAQRLLVLEANGTADQAMARAESARAEQEQADRQRREAVDLAEQARSDQQEAERASASAQQAAASAELEAVDAAARERQAELEASRSQALRVRAQSDAARAREQESLAAARALAAGQAASAAEEAAVRNRIEADRQAGLAGARALASQATSDLEGNLDRSLLLSLQALRIAEVPEALDSLVRGLQHEPNLVTFLRPSSDSLASALSPDGAVIAAGTVGGTVERWDLGTYQPLATLHSDAPIWSVAFSPDGTRVYGGDGTGRLLGWRTDTGELLFTVDGAHGGGQPVTSLAVSRDGILASAGVDGTIALWETSGHQPVELVRARPLAPLLAVAWSPDGRAVAWAAGSSDQADGRAGLWRVLDGGAPTWLHGHSDQVWSVAFSPDGATLASASEDGTVRRYDPRTGVEVAPPLEHGGLVFGVAWASDGATLATVADDGAVRRWDATDGTLQGEPWLAHDNAARTVHVPPDGRRLVSRGDDGALIVWDAAPGGRSSRALVSVPGFINAVAVTPDGDRVAAAAGDPQHVRGSAENAIHVIDPRTGQLAAPPLRGHESAASAVDFSPDGTTLASGGMDGTVIVWDVASGRARAAPLRGHADAVMGVSFSPDGTTVASASRDGTVRLWDASTGQAIGGPLAGHDGWVYDVAWSPTGAELASAGRDGVVVVWDPRDGRVLRRLVGHVNAAFAVAFSADGSLLASASGDRSVILWDVATGAVRRTLPAAGHALRSVALSGDGQRVAAGTAEGPVLVWDVPSGRRIGGGFPGHAGWPVNDVAFTPDGSGLISGADDGLVLVTEVGLDALQASACRIANRQLTEAEVSEFLAGRPAMPTCP